MELIHHLKSDSILKFITVITPIEEIPAEKAVNQVQSSLTVSSGEGTLQSQENVSASRLLNPSAAVGSP